MRYVAVETLKDKSSQVSPAPPTLTENDSAFRSTLSSILLQLHGIHHLRMADMGPWGRQKT